MQDLKRGGRFVVGLLPDEHKSGGAIVEVSGKVKKISDTDGTIVMADDCKIRLSDIVYLCMG
jgi:hypothetical protein